MKLFSGFPFEGEVFDYFPDFNRREFRNWSELVPEWEYEPELPYFSILVPTSDTVKFKFLLDKLVSGGCNLLLSGETGTGKSIVVNDFLNL